MNEEIEQEEVEDQVIEMPEDQFNTLVEQAADKSLRRSERQEARSSYFTTNKERLDADPVLKGRIADILDQSDELDLDLNPEDAGAMASIELVQRAEKEKKTESVGQYTDEQIQSLNADEYAKVSGLGYSTKTQEKEDPDAGLTAVEYAQKYGLTFSDGEERF